MLAKIISKNYKKFQNFTENYILLMIIPSAQNGFAKKEKFR
jgi:hypothetical protein